MTIGMPTLTYRCTYCLKTKPTTGFTTVEHVMPAALGGEWKTRKVCDDCQKQANEVADHLINKDFLVVFLRSAYGIADRSGHVPLPPRFNVPLEGAGVVKVTLESAGAVLQGATSPVVAALLGLKGESEQDQERLRELVGEDIRKKLHDPVQLARAIQAETTPPPAWSRFIAKLGLACGRKAYGEEWMEGPYAHALSADLHSDEPPKHSQQREHYPPLGEAWPFLPPRHVLWIDDVRDVAILHVVLFGQLLGAVALNNAGAPSEYSAWRFEPAKREFGHSSYPAIWLGTAAALASRTGRRSVSVLGTESPFLYVEDGPEGPMEIPAPTLRAESAVDALRIASRHLREEPSGLGSSGAEPQETRRCGSRVGRNQPCPCGSGLKHKRCCGLKG
jgi:HNH endonuclease/SEC-C motif